MFIANTIDRYNSIPNNPIKKLTGATYYLSFQMDEKLIFYQIF